MKDVSIIKENIKIIEDCLSVIAQKSTGLEYGSCSIVFVYHSGKITKSEIQITENLKNNHC